MNAYISRYQCQLFATKCLKQETCIQATSSKIMQPLESAVVECYIINIVYQNWNNELVTPLCQTDSLQNFLLKA